MIAETVDVCKGVRSWYYLRMYEDAITNAVNLLNHANELTGSDTPSSDFAILGLGYAVLALALKPADSEIVGAVRSFLEAPSPDGWATLQGAAGWPHSETK